MKQSLTAPALAGDDEKTRAAWMLSVILWAAIVVEALTLVIMPLISRYEERPLALISLAAALVANLLMLAGLHRGRVRLVTWGCIAETWVLGVMILYASGTVHTPTVALFILTILLGAALGGRATIAGCTLLSIGTVIALGWAEVEGHLPPAFDVTGTWAPVVAASFVLVVVAVLLVLVHHNVASAMDRWRRNERELAGSNRALQAARASLEQQVAERTASAEAARQEAEVARRAAEAQAWQAAGLVQLGDALRGEQHLPSLAGQAIRHLCRCLDAPVGALLLTEDGLLRLAGSYACTPQARQFAPGESLAGQAARDGQPILVHDVPEDYMPIVSGLGTAPPRQVVIWPLLYEGQALGVVELGLLDDLSPPQRQFLERAAEPVAIALHTAQSRARIDGLLAEMQAQAGELALREEELRAINEELQARAKSRPASRPAQER